MTLSITLKNVLITYVSKNVLSNGSAYEDFVNHRRIMSIINRNLQPKHAKTPRRDLQAFRKKCNYDTNMIIVEKSSIFDS